MSSFIPALYLPRRLGSWCWDDDHFTEEATEAHSLIRVPASKCWSQNLNLGRLQIFCLSLVSLSNSKTQKKRKQAREKRKALCGRRYLANVLAMTTPHRGLAYTHVDTTWDSLFQLACSLTFSTLLSFTEKMLI